MAKKNVVIADFSKIEARLKALSVRFWGKGHGVPCPLGSETLINKGLYNRKFAKVDLIFYVPPQF